MKYNLGARLGDHQGLPQGLFSAWSYFLGPTGNHTVVGYGQAEKGILGVVSTFFQFIASVVGFIACHILATKDEHMTSFISWKCTYY